MLVRLFGVLTLFGAIASLMLYWQNAEARQQGGYDLSPILIYFYFGVPLGLGLLFLRKWAAIILSLFSLAMAAWLSIGSLLYVPFPFMLINILFSLIFLLPSAATLYSWQELIWKGKYYL